MNSIIASSDGKMNAKKARCGMARVQSKTRRIGCKAGERHLAGLGDGLLQKAAFFRRCVVGRFHISQCLIRVFFARDEIGQFG